MVFRVMFLYLPHIAIYWYEGKNKGAKDSRVRVKKL
jgi:hypothetical protein